MRKALACAVALGLFAGCSNGDNGSPTSPTPNPSPSPSVTRIMALEGDLNFGDVLVGTSADKVIRIVNRGSDTLTVSGMTMPASGGFAASWTQGQIASNQWQDVTVRFAPTAIQSYSGTWMVNGNHTSGTNTMPIAARGQRERWSRTGVGNQVFDMPADVTRVRIIGTFGGFSSNFVIRVGGRLVVNELLGTGWTSTRYEGTHLVSGGVTEITNSNNVSWSFEELR